MIDYKKNKTKQNKTKTKKTRRRYKNFFKEEKENKWQYGHECNENLSEDEKQKLFEYLKKYYIMRKNDI